MPKDIINVKDYHLLNRCVYSGEFDNYEEEPYGWGIMKYPDGHEAIGTFIKIPNGVAYINYGNYMQLGFFLQGRLNGWGIQMGKGTYNFGYYKDGVLVKDCTDEIYDLPEFSNLDNTVGELLDEIAPPDYEIHDTDSDTVKEYKRIRQSHTH